MATISRQAYAEMFGPTIGDRVRLADTGLIVEVEDDYTLRAGGYGEEVKFGGGKTIRDGMGQSQRVSAETADTVITNALVIDHWGIVKADVAIKAGRIAALGKAGNPDVQLGRRHRHRPGHRDHRRRRDDPHRRRHRLAHPLHLPAADRGGAGERRDDHARRRHRPCDRHLRDHLHARPVAHPAMLKAAESFPMNLGFMGKGNASLPAALDEQVEAGAYGLKLHEDWGTTPAAIDNCLAVADATTCRSRSTPTRSTSRASSRTRSPRSRAARSRPSTPKARAAATRPTSSRWPAWPNVLPSSTNPTMPYTVNTIDEHLDMLMVCHHLDPAIAEDLAFAESRIRRETIAAEDILHDLGVISMMSSDSQAMGRVGEVIIRTWQAAHKMKAQRGRLAPEGNDRGASAPAIRGTTTSASSATSPSTRSTRRSRRASATRSARSRSASSPTWWSGSRPSSASSRRS